MVLSTEWLEKHYCLKYGCSRRCHETKNDGLLHKMRRTKNILWEQVAHVSRTAASPTVSDFSAAMRSDTGANSWTENTFDRNRNLRSRRVKPNRNFVISTTEV